MKNRLLLFANDAASANVTIAYASLYGHNYDTILAFPNNVAKNLYKEHIPEYLGKGDIYFQGKDTIVTGTSGINSEYEMGIIEEAKKAKVANTIAIVDNISNFEMRFVINNTIKNSHIPDEIWVFEKRFSSTNKILNNKIKYKKNIYIQFLQDFYTKKPPSIENSSIRKYEGQYLVILTEYLYELYGIKYGFTEYDVVESILIQISSLNLNIPIFLKLHPREHKNKFNILLRKYEHLNICIIDCNIQEIIYYSKMVLGINSSVFIECNVFKKPHFSVQINAKKNISLSFTKNENILYTQNELKNIIGKYYNNKNS